MSVALRGQNVHTAVLWRSTFNEQRAVWAVSYSRAPWPAKQRPALFVPDGDASMPARRPGVAA